jgi:hypothetical protein
LTTAQQPSDGRQALEESIQNCCGALLALHASVRSLAAVPGEHEEIEQELSVAIELVRAAVDQLQMAPVEPRGVPPGFVDRHRPIPPGLT